MSLWIGTCRKVPPLVPSLRDCKVSQQKSSQHLFIVGGPCESEYQHPARDTLPVPQHAPTMSHTASCLLVRCMVALRTGGHTQACPPRHTHDHPHTPTLNRTHARRFYKNFSKSKKKAFTKYAKKYTDGKKQIEAELEQLKRHCCVIRVLAHTQVCCREGTCARVRARMCVCV